MPCLLRALIDQKSHNNINLDYIQKYGYWRGQTPLIIAISNLNHKCAEYLLKGGAKPNMKDTRENFSSAPLHHAIDTNDIASVKLLLHYKANINITDDDTRTPLIKLIDTHRFYLNNTDYKQKAALIAQLLIQKGATKPLEHHLCEQLNNLLTFLPQEEKESTETMEMH